MKLTKDIRRQSQFLIFVEKSILCTQRSLSVNTVILKKKCFKTTGFY